MKKIAVWNPAFLGDAVLTLPLIRALHLRFPQAKLHFWVRGGYAPLFRAQPELSAVHEFAKRSGQRGVQGVLRVAKEMRDEQYDCALFAHKSFRSGMIAVLSGAGRKIGYTAPWFHRVAYTDSVPRNFDSQHEVERLMNLAAPLGISGESPWPELVLDSGAEERAESFWGKHFRGVNKAPVLGVHPGSVWATKRWPEDYYGRLIRRAADEGVHIVVFAGPGEERCAAAALHAAGAPSQAINLSGKLSLIDFAAYIARLDCMVCNDSGPMHLAWVQRRPVVAVFGPTVESFGFTPRGRKAVVMQQDVSCRPCGLHGGRTCPEGHHMCMRDTTPEHVWEAVRKMLWEK